MMMAIMMMMLLCAVVCLFAYLLIFVTLSNSLSRLLHFCFKSFPFGSLTE
jgi:hypothetical protein